MRKVFLILAGIFFIAPTAEPAGKYYYGAALGHPTKIIGGVEFGRVSYEMDLGVAGGDFSAGLSKITNESPCAVSIWECDFPLHYGWGIAFKNSCHPQFGLKGILLGSYYIRNGRYEIFAELAPALRLMPSYGANLDFSIGVKFR